MTEENTELQIDEVEALASIYGDDWVSDITSNGVYSVTVNDENAPSKRITLQITLPDNYPTEAPPKYEVHAPWMLRDAKVDLCNRLESIYIENLGQPILYLWIECVREFLEKSLEGETSSADFQEENKKVTSEVVDQEQSGGTSPDCSLAGNMAEGHPVIYHSDFLRDRKSIFQAHLAPVHSVDDVKAVMESLLSNKRIADATHNIQAYRIIKEEPRHLVISDHEDDGEFGASGRMLNVMNLAGVENVIVVVTRWYGGVHLGPDRFKHINSMTRNMLVEYGYIKPKGDKKGPKSKKSK